MQALRVCTIRPLPNIPVSHCVLPSIVSDVIANVIRILKRCVGSRAGVISQLGLPKGLLFHSTSKFA